MIGVQMMTTSRSGYFHYICLVWTADELNYRYSTFVRVGTGLSYSDYEGVRSRPWKVWDPKSPPAFLQTSQKESAEDKGDMYLEPQE